MKNNTLHIKIYWGWSQIKGGKRFHVPILGLVFIFLHYYGVVYVPTVLMLLPFLLSSLFFTSVEGVTYFVLGMTVFEMKFYLGERSPLPEIQNEEVLNKLSSDLRRIVERGKAVEINVLSKQLKISTGSVEKLVKANGYVLEDGLVFNEIK